MSTAAYELLDDLALTDILWCLLSLVCYYVGTLGSYLCPTKRADLVIYHIRALATNAGATPCSSSVVASFSSLFLPYTPTSL